jgi:hypothetical protein
VRLHNTAGEVLNLLLSHNLQTSFPDVVTAYMLILTLPTTVATAERSFLKLKIIKNYLRSTCGQSRLSALATLFIERARANYLNRAKIVSEFTFAKSRKRNCNV